MFFFIIIFKDDPIQHVFFFVLFFFLFLCGVDSYDYSHGSATSVIRTLYELCKRRK